MEKIIQNLDNPIKEIGLSAFDRLIQKGEKRGADSILRRSIKNMYLEQVSVSNIAKFLDISEERVKEILQQLVEQGALSSNEEGK